VKTLRLRTPQRASEAPVERNLDLNLERGDDVPAFHFHTDFISIHPHVLGNCRQDLLPENCNQVALAGDRAFMGQENLKPLTRYRS